MFVLQYFNKSLSYNIAVNKQLTGKYKIYITFAKIFSNQISEL